LTLRDLEDKGNLFCKPTTKETVEGERATVTRFVRRLVMVRTASGGALASRSSFTALPCSPQAPPWSIALDVDESSSCGGYLCALGFGACETKFDVYVPLFIGLLGPTHRGDGVLYFLSINRTPNQLRLENCWKGMNFGFVTIRKPNFWPS
jgi:hypothetical protein